MGNYMISISNISATDNGIIHDPRSKLKVKAFESLNTAFKPSHGELNFFVTAQQNEIVFETEGYKKHKELLILQMISRYCVYLALEDAKIHYGIPARLAS